MVAKNVLRQVGHVIYRLKRQYGRLMYIRYRQAADQYNLETGDITRDLTSIKIRKGVLLPQRVTREFVYDLSFIAANKNFTYGGFFQQGDRVVLIDAKDLPRDFEINGEMYVTIEDRRYEIQEHRRVPEDLPRGYAWLLRVKQITASDDDVVEAS